MVQGQQVKGPARVGLWVEAEPKVGAGWVGHLRQGRAEIVSVRTVEQRSLMLQVSLVMRKAVLSVEQK